MPDKVKNAPVLNDELLFFLTVYDDLCSCVYFSGGQIPHNEIVTYCQSCGFDDETSEAVKIVIRSADLSIIEHRAAKQLREAKRKRHKKGK